MPDSPGTLKQVLSTEGLREDSGSEDSMIMRGWVCENINVLDKNERVVVRTYFHCCFGGFKPCQ